MFKCAWSDSHRYPSKHWPRRSMFWLFSVVVYLQKWPSEIIEKFLKWNSFQVNKRCYLLHLIRLRFQGYRCKLDMSLILTNKDSPCKPFIVDIIQLTTRLVKLNLNPLVYNPTRFDKFILISEIERVFLKLCVCWHLMPDVRYCRIFWVVRNGTENCLNFLMFKFFLYKEIESLQKIEFSNYYIFATWKYESLK